MSLRSGQSFISSKRTQYSKAGSRFVRIPYWQVLDTEIEEMLNNRRNLSITKRYGDVITDVTPKLLEVNNVTATKYKTLNSTFKAVIYDFSRRSSRSSIQSRQSMQSRSSIAKPKMGGFKLSLDDILGNVGSLQNVYREVQDDDIFDEVEPIIQYREYNRPLIKITLRKSQEFILYEAQSITEPKGSEFGDFVEEDNKIYDYLTIGRGMMRRRSDAETQTITAIMKTRFANTYYREFESKASYVSFFEVYDTYKTLSKNTAQSPRDSRGSGELQIRRHSVPFHKISVEQYMKEQLDQIGKRRNFLYSSMVMERMLASNVHKEGQLRFRNMTGLQRTADHAEYHYSLKELFTFEAPKFETSRITGKMRKAVSDISFCYSNGDIMAVAYGLFSYSALVMVSTGNVCIWSIKNPRNPERTYNYNIPVTAVEFSPFLPFLLAVGMFDGSVEVRDITVPHAPPIAVTHRTISLNREPVIAIKWIQQQNDNADIDPILALSLNGTVSRYCVINGPYLLSFNQMKLERIEGTPEGLDVEPTQRASHWFSNSHPLGLNITMHPLAKDIYYLLTDEGCVYKCSTNHTHTYLEVWRTHEGSVNCMDFSPWSPKLFLTCGNDWRIRIWMEGIFKPLITLSYKMKPIYSAKWSRTHSTIIIAVNRASVDIWDIRRSLLAPVSRTRFSTSFNTTFEYNLGGLSAAFGDERGDVHVCALDNMPFPPRFQYDELRNALYGAATWIPDLLIELKSVGYFGYPRKGFVRPP